MDCVQYPAPILKVKSMKKALVLVIVFLSLTACHHKNPMSTSPIIAYFSADSYNLVLGNSAILSWDVSDADSVRITGVGDVPHKGTVTVSPKLTTSYSISANNKYSLVQQSLTITVR